MSVENNFLQKTVLTSTENKYLSEENFSNCNNFGLHSKSQFPVSILEVLKQNPPKHALITTENKFLEDYTSVPKKRLKLQKRKKKKICKQLFADNCSLERDRETESLEDILHCYEETTGFAQEKAPESIHRRMPQLAGFAPLPSGSSAYNTSQCRSVPDGFGTTFGSPAIAASQSVQFGFGATSGSPPVATLQSEQMGFGNILGLCALPRAMHTRYAKARSTVFSFTPDINILEMPVYDFYSKESYQMEVSESFIALDDGDMLQLEKVKKIKAKKMQFLNTTSMALICSCNLKNANDSYRTFLVTCADEVCEFEPEFILKVALYARQEMNIRSASNFLLAYAAYHEETRPYLEKYFSSCIRLPSDWIEVAELYQVFADERLKCRSLPAVLKRVMKKSFSKFDLYQLGKYNRRKTKKKHEFLALNASSSESENKDEKSSHQSFTLKQLIRLLHLNSPANEIMCLLGKKYPETDESFKKSGLPGTWDKKRAGERMKLPQPETWETQISVFGNKPSMWEALIDNSKLPYMAMLRNLKNLILSGISMKHHNKILKQLENKHAVINSRQLPLQFFEAFKILTSIEDLLNNKMVSNEENTVIPAWKQRQIEKTCNRIENASSMLLKCYKDAVSKALEISALHNLQPIPGISLIICDVLEPDKVSIKTKNKVYQISIMMALMCLKACEDSKMKLIYGDSSETVLLNNDHSFLENMLETCSKHQDAVQSLKTYSSVKALKRVVDYYLRQQVVLRERLDHVVYLRTSEAETGSGVKTVMMSFLNKYRQIVNPELLYTDVDFSSNKNSFTDNVDPNGKDLYLCGNTTQLIKFIAERSTCGQLSYVDNIDTKYQLSMETDFIRSNKRSKESPETEAISICSRVPKWQTVRIFISSTFKDMHSERDMLIRFVFPELRKRAASVFVKINEVDLRWGITETDCASKRAAEICLLEAQNSDIFIGILGDRYGTIYDFEPPNSPDLQWVKEYPRDLSITELEMHAGALRSETQKSALFYIRNNIFLSLVPEKWKSYFTSESTESMNKLETLKSTIKSSGFKVFDDYPCRFAGILKEKPVLAGLDAFGKAVLDDLWKLISEKHEKDPYVDDIAEEEIYQQHLLDSIDYFIETKNSPMIPFVKNIENQSGIFLVSGSSGSGKTTFIVNVLRKLKQFSVVKFFVGLTPRSTDLAHILHFICSSIARTYPVSFVPPKLKRDIENQFSEILHAAVTSGTSNFVLVLDGLDHLPIDDQMLDWLPLNLPPGFRLICSASDTSYAFKVLCERQVHGSTVYLKHLGAIDQSDRESIVRRYLNLYGKTLDESPFNNQMLQLVTKKDSGVPLYLRISCDFLRTYASFENFTSMIQSLPSTIPLILKEIILQMENEHGSFLVQTTFTLLCITKEGLDDTDLHLMLSLALFGKGKSGCQSFQEIFSHLTSLKPENMMSKVTYCSLLHLISNFAYGNTRVRKHNLKGTEFERAVKVFYLNKNYSNYSKQMDRSLAAYYKTICDPRNDSTWKGHSVSAFRGLVYHLFHGQCYETLGDYLCCLKFLEAICSVNAAECLLEYYSALLMQIKTGNNEAVRKMDFLLISSYKSFFSRNLHIFQVNPHLMTQQALNEPLDSLVRSCVKKDTIKSCLIENISVQAYDPRNATIGGFLKKVSSISCQNVEPVALLGSEDGYLKVLDLTSKKIIRSIQSHSSTITFICVAGKQLVTASSDTTLSIWNSVDFSRISVLKGHKHSVSCCCTDSSFTILLSSGWDNSVRLWSLRDGRSISVIDDFKCPVNCLDHHPMKQQFACGLWNGSIEIWDTVSLTNMLVLSNNSRSVKCLAYTPEGINIISSYMNADVIIWSSEQGTKISSLKGHSLPVKCISYSFTEDMIISGSDDCTLKLWPTKPGVFLHNLTVCKFCPISLIEIISPNFLAICYQNADLWVIDVNNGSVVSKTKLDSDMVSCFSRVSGAYYDTDDPFENWTDVSLVFGSQSGNISIMSFSSSSITSVGSVSSRVTAVTHNKRIIISANCEGDIGVFFYPEMSSKLVYGAHKGYVTTLSLNIISGTIFFVSAASDKAMKSWVINYEDKDVKLNHVYSSRHKDFVTSCCWFSSSNENLEIEAFITGSHDNNVILQKDNSETIFRGLKTSVVCVDYTEKYIVGCGSDGSVTIWSNDGKILSYISGIEQSSAVLSFHIDKDATNDFDITLAFADKDGSVKIQKPIERPYCYSLEGHSNGITSCCTNQTGEIISCSLDGTINIWKLPSHFQDTMLNHSGAVTDILQSNSDNIVLSSDADGSIVLWELCRVPTFSLLYGTKKTYVGGYVNAMSWLKDRNFVCAVTQTLASKEIYFLDILSYDYIASEDCKQYNLQVKFTHYFDSEVLSLHTNPTSDTIVATFKSGDLVVIAPDFKRKFKTSEDWILKAKVYEFDVEQSTSQYLYIVLLSGAVKCVEFSRVLKFSEFGRLDFEELYSPTSQDIFFASVFSCETKENFIYGDTQGWLRVFLKKKMCFSKKVHEEAITGISVMRDYIFTCSLDRTLKGWNIMTLDQVYQFHSPAPITCIVSCDIISEDSSTATYFLVIGTTSGTIQLLKVYTKN